MPYLQYWIMRVTTSPLFRNTKAVLESLLQHVEYCILVCMDGHGLATARFHIAIYFNKKSATEGKAQYSFPQKETERDKEQDNG
jgi:hypothetical protein